jgi:prolyl-tRNA editing enzyme YbaK/EbsC (Cys-tRNA(Pro) deacylase)
MEMEHGIYDYNVDKKQVAEAAATAATVRHNQIMQTLSFLATPATEQLSFHVSFVSRYFSEFLDSD